MGMTSTSINIPDYMEGVFGARQEGHHALHLVMDPDHPIPITSAPASPQEAAWEIGVGGGVTLPQFRAMFLFSFFQCGTDEWTGRGTCCFIPVTFV